MLVTPIVGPFHPSSTCLRSSIVIVAGAFAATAAYPRKVGFCLRRCEAARIATASF